MTKRKLYWILMPPFFIVAALMVLLLPNQYIPFAYLIVLIFWIVYYSLNLWLRKKADYQKHD